MVGRCTFQVQERALEETSRSRGHNYITTFVDLGESKVVLATEGKDAGTINASTDDLEGHSSQPSRIQEICCDPAFINGVNALSGKLTVPLTNSMR